MWIRAWPASDPVEGFSPCLSRGIGRGDFAQLVVASVTTEGLVERVAIFEVRVD